MNKGFNRHNTCPVKEGEEFDVKIEAVGEKGDGIARVKGFVLFVPNTKTGDEVRIRVTRVLNKVGFAEVISGSTGKQADKEEPAEEGDSEDSGDSEGSEESEENFDESLDSEDFGDEN